ncbi:snapalysin family zinc-dependent metalloprotease [Gandjariella thermophila]|uniref:Extracellular small neutral protease n=1 Tax=Gandjariella thermophila TaxID=1931992 RepID=A0A4D4JEJ5_9PSEU|nr:snapalysin family zinc-dependent metalloprotease [Gandjariella thermophila]GDY32273.1 peptidase [Gandjariella thermophila]
MLGGRVGRIAGAVITLVLPLLGGAIAEPSAEAAPPSPHAARIVYYDASGAAEFKQAVDEGAQAWNAAVHNVQLRPAGPGQAQVTVLADDGWPRTEPSGLGAGTVYMGREAVSEGFYPPRIAAHEFGHILGLPDNRNGRCDYLMSGHSSPTSCRSTTPHPSEAQQVEQNFAGGSAAYRVAAVKGDDGCFRAPESSEPSAARGGTARAAGARHAA